MPYMAKPLISRRTRSAFQEHLVGWVLRDIHRVFDDEEVQRGPAPAEIDGARRGLVAEYYAGVDWTNPTQVAQVLRAYETILAEEAGGPPPPLVETLARDGYGLDSSGRLRRGIAAPIDRIPLNVLTDPAALEEHIARIEAAADGDVPQSISAAKALIEATAKLVLRQLGVAYDEAAKMHELINAAQKALSLHPSVLAPTAKGAKSIERVLSGLAQVAIGIAELRNEYGPDHGRSQPIVGLTPRHAHLAVGAAVTYCRMLLETLDAPGAPWRRNVPSPAGK